tara:strand:+ start:5103 stop:6092 length:990 start_codon:yes stop_codon:yes gene_type:complete
MMSLFTQGIIMKKFKLVVASIALSVSGASSALPLIQEWGFVNEAGFDDAAPSAAVTESGSSTDPSVNGGVSILSTGALPDNICWGTPSPRQSCLGIFSPVSEMSTQTWDDDGNLVDIVNGMPGPQGMATTVDIGVANYFDFFSQGTAIRHDNFAITGTFLDTVKIVDGLKLTSTTPSLSFTAPELEFMIDFTETPNRTAGDSCPYGDDPVGTAGSVNVNGCADAFAIAGFAGGNIIAQSVDFIDFAVSFVVNTGGLYHEHYEIITRLSGLEVFNDGTQQGFLTPEAGVSVLDAQFVIRAIEAPEPTSIAMFGLGLLGLAGFSRKKSKQA